MYKNDTYTITIVAPEVKWKIFNENYLDSDHRNDENAKALVMLFQDNLNNIIRKKGSCATSLIIFLMSAIEQDEEYVVAMTNSMKEKNSPIASNMEIINAICMKNEIFLRGYNLSLSRNFLEKVAQFAIDEINNISAKIFARLTFQNKEEYKKYDLPIPIHCQDTKLRKEPDDSQSDDERPSSKPSSTQSNANYGQKGVTFKD